MASLRAMSWGVEITIAPMTYVSHITAKLSAETFNGKREVGHTIELNLLGDSQLHVPRSRRKIEDKDVQPAPVYFVKELLQSFHHHQSAPYHGCGLVRQEEAHRH